MQKQEKSRKPLIIGIIAAVVILAILLVLLLTQCTGGQGDGSSKPATESTSEEVPTYELYWNVDRAEYAGKSEAGMSSRMPEEDGYFHVRFFAEGETITLKVADRRLVNAIDIQDVMGLEFDENGIVINVLSLDDMPLEKVGWQFYVQSAARTMIKLNSSESMNGMEVLLEDLDPDRIWDMSGKSGPIGTVDKAIDFDKIMAVQNLAGQVTHVFIYERPNYMLTHEAYCEHCKETVTWYEWVKTGDAPNAPGHYQLQNDITMTVGQRTPAEDSKICLDLNGYRIDGKNNSRVYAIMNVGTTLAIMDTSEEKTGVIATHGKHDQGGPVWLPKGVLYMYGGTLDASDSTTQKSGTALSTGSGTFFYMYGGTIIGGTSTYTYNAEKNTYGAGVGGAVYCGGKFVMHDGEIRDGYAESAAIYKNGKLSGYQRGLGGNVYFSGTAEFEMNGGTIKNGRCGGGGANIYGDGASEITINGGTIAGGITYGKGRNGGSIFLGSKTTFTMNSGSIYGGVCYNAGGNVYTNGTFIMNGGYIGGGQCYNFDTRKLNTGSTNTNLFIVNGKVTMWGGTIAGGVGITDTKAGDNKPATIALYGVARITGGSNGIDLTVANSECKVVVGKLYDGAKIGVSTTKGLFSEITSKDNLDNFYSNIEGAEVVYYEQRLGLGRISCICGKSHGETVSEEHINGCDSKVLFWAPWTSTNNLPTATGNYYLLKEVTTTKQIAILAADQDVKVDFNGKNVTLKVGSNQWDGFRLYRADKGSVLTLTDTTDTPAKLQTVMPAAGTKYTGGKVKQKEIKDKDGKVIETIYFERGSAEEQEEVERLWGIGNGGMLLWARGGIINVHNGIFDGSNLTGAKDGMVVTVGSMSETNAETDVKTTWKGVVNVYGGTIIGGFTQANGNIVVNDGSMNVYGGTITSGRSINGGNIAVLNGTLNVYGGTITKGLVDRSHEEVDGGHGGNIYIGYDAGKKLYGTANIYGGTVSDGIVKAGKKGGGHGGNIYVAGTLNATGGTVSGGQASSTGGNICTVSTNALITLKGIQVLNGQANAGGNIGVGVRSCKGLYILDKTVVSGGKANYGGNVSVRLNEKNTTVDQDQIIEINGATITEGTAKFNGGNICLLNPTKDSFKTDEKTGEEKRASYKINLNVTVKNATVTDGTVEGGTDHARGGNFYLEGVVSATVDNTKVLDGVCSAPSGKYGYGGNFYLYSAGCKVFLQNKSVVSGGTVSSASNSWSPAGNIYVDKGVLEITDSTVSGGKGTHNSNNIYINYGAQVTLHSGSIENTQAGESNVFMQGGTFTMNDGSVTNAEGVNARNIHTNANGIDKNPNNPEKWPVITINGGTVSGGKFGDNGGNIYAANGVTVEINGGKIIGGQSGNVAGNIYVAYKLTVNGGEISGGKSAKNGGNIYAANGVTLEINGGKIVGGESTTDSGGNIYSNGKLTVNGGEISGGKTAKNPNSVNIFVVDGDLEITGGVIDGGVSAAGANSIAMSGKPVITKNASGITINNGDYSKDNDIQLTGTLEKGSEVWVTGSGIISGVTAEENAKYFHSLYAAPADKVYYISEDLVQAGPAVPGASDVGKLFIGAKYCVCGASLVKNGKHATFQDADGNTVGCNGKDLLWAPWGSASAQPKESGNWYLTKDVTLRSESGYNKEVSLKLDLNDHTLQMVPAATNGKTGARVFRMWASGNAPFNADITVTNSNRDGNDKTGVVRSEMKGGQDGMIFWLTQPTHTVNVYGGIFDASGITMATGKPGSVGKINKGVLNIYGGEFVGGTTNSAGGGFALDSGATLNMFAGKIRDGGVEVGDISGGNIYIKVGAVMNMYGGEIYGGRAPGGVTANSNGAIWGGYGGNILLAGTLNMSGGTIRDGRGRNGENICLYARTAGKTATLNMSGGTITGGVALDDRDGDISITLSGSPIIDKSLTDKDCPVKPTSSLSITSGVIIDAKGIEEGGKVYVTGKPGKFGVAASGNKDFIKDVFVTETSDAIVLHNGQTVFDLYFGKTYCLCGASEKENAEHAYWCDKVEHPWIPWDGSEFVASGYYYLSDNKPGGQTKIGSSGEVDVVLDLNGYSYTGNNRAFQLNKGSLGITDASGKNTGKIVGHGTTDNGQSGVMLLGSGTEVNLYAGTVQFDLQGTRTVRSGGVAEVANGTFNMYGGKLIGDTAGEGGVLNLVNRSVCNFYGGTIEGGNAVAGTFGKYTREGLGGSIKVSGGAVLNIMAHDDDTEKTAERLITGGSAVKGGAIYITSGDDGAGVVNFHSGTIEGGTANNGGNIYVADGGQFNLYSGTIKGGQAANGGNVYVEAGATFNAKADPNDPASQTADRVISGGIADGLIYDAAGNATQDHAHGGNIYSLGTVNLMDGTQVKDGLATATAVAAGNRYGYGGNIGIEAGLVTIDGAKILNGSVFSYTTALVASNWAPGGNIDVRKGGDLTVSGGAEISGGNANNAGAGCDGLNIYMTTDSSSITLNECTISNSLDAVAANRSSIVLEKGTLNINEGAKIKNTGDNVANITTNGAGKAANIVMTGGLIEGGQRNVIVDADDSFTMSGGIVQNGIAPTMAGSTARTNGGNFLVCGGTAAGNGGKLVVSGDAKILGGMGDARGLKNADNGALEGAYGGSIRLDNYGTLEMTGGTISGGKALGDGSGRLGGNIALGGSSVATITGGTVELGEAATGGNIGTNATNASITIGGDAIVKDGKADRGGNLALNVRGCKSFVIEGKAQILDGEATVDYGGNIYMNCRINQNGTITMKNGTVSGGKATTNGNNIYIVGGTDSGNKFYSYFTVDGGTIFNSNDGTNIYVDKLAGFTLNNGIVESDGKNKGRNLYLSATATATVNNGVICNAYNSGNGANIYVDDDATFTFNNGLIYGGKTEDSGGNIAVYGTLNIAGGKIYGGSCLGTGAKARETTNIFVVNGDLNISGGEIWGGVGVAQTGTGVSNVTLSGAPVINKSLCDSTVTDKPAISLELNAAVDADISGLTGGTIFIKGIVGDRIAVNAKDSDAAKYFKSEVTYGGVEIPVAYVEAEKALYLGNPEDTYCLCGSSKNDGAYECQCDGKDRVWVQWTNQYQLPTDSGNYYLAYDVTPDKVVTLDGGEKIAIDLRGHTITLETDEKLYEFVDDGGASVILTDSTKEADKVGSVVFAENSTASTEGGMFDLKTGNTFEMYRITLDGTNLTNSKNGGVAYVRADATMTIHSGTIEGATAAQAGVAYVRGTLTLKNGTVRNGESTNGGGGNIWVQDAKGSFTMKNGTVSGGKATEGGYNIRVAGGASFTMEDGTVSNTNKSVSSVYVQSSTMTMSGGTVSCNVLLHSGANASKLSLSGKVVIEKLTLSVVGTNKTTPVFEITSALLDGSSVNIDSVGSKMNADLTNMKDTVFSPANAAVNTASAQYLHDLAGQQICVITEEDVNESAGKLTTADVGKLYIGQVHCVCGGLLTAHGTGHEICDASLHIWHPTATVPTQHNDKSTGRSDSEYYYLTKTATLSGAVGGERGLSSVQNKHLYIDLNGFEIVDERDYDTRLFVIRKNGSNGVDSENCSVTLTNTKKDDDSTITVVSPGEKKRSQGAFFWYQGGTNNTFRMFNLTVDFKATNKNGSDHAGGAIAVGGTNNDVLLWNVNFTSTRGAASGYATDYVHLGGTDCTVHAVNSSFKNAWSDDLRADGVCVNLGGALSMDKATATMILENCTITGNKSTANGAGVSLKDGTLVLKGNTTITGNTLTDGKAANIYVTGGKIQLDDSFTGEVGISGLENIVVVPGKSIDEAPAKDNLIADSDSNKLADLNGNIILTGSANVIQCACGGQVAAGLGEHQHTALVFTPWAKTDSLPTTSGNYILQNNVDLTAAWTPNSNSVINLDLAGKTVTQTAGVARILDTTDRSNVKVSITDSVGNGTMKAAPGTYTDEGGIAFLKASTGSVLNLYAGTLEANGHIVSNDCKKDGGTDTANWDAGDNDTTAERNGGLIAVNNGCVFNMYGGTVTGGETVKAELTKLDANGTEIKITPHYSSHGGNIAIVSGTMNMYGGTVKDGKSLAGNGGNIGVMGTFNMSGGTVSGGQATTGGNIAIWKDKTATISGTANVTKGVASTTGGNVQVRDGGKLRMDGGTISGGYGVTSGGNVYLGSSGVLTLEKGSILDGYTGNPDTTAEGSGGNVYVGAGAEFIMLDGTVTGGFSINKNKLLADKNKSNTTCNIDVHGIFTMSGGDATGSVCLQDTSETTIFGVSKIYTAEVAVGIRVEKGAKLTFKDLSADAKFRFRILDSDYTAYNNGGNPLPIASVEGETDASKFVCQNATYKTRLTDGKLYIEK